MARYRKPFASRPPEKGPTESKRLAPFLRLLRAVHSAGLPGSMDAAELERQRKGQELLGKLVAPMAGMTWEPFDLEGMPAAWMWVDPVHRRRHAILYCHGGGYTSGNLGYARVLASKLAHVTGYEVLTFAYRLAPEHPYPAAPEDAVKAWDHLMHLGYGARDVVVAGDSAGGNLALTLCRRLRQAGRMLPGALVLMSPWTDMTASSPSYEEQGELDPMLTREYIQAVRAAYAPGMDYADPELSPLLGDLTGFPPALIQVGEHEILLDDARQLHQRLEEARIPCRLEVWEDMWHVFQMFPTKKAGQAMTNVSRFLLDLW